MTRSDIFEAIKKMDPNSILDLSAFGDNIQVRDQAVMEALEAEIIEPVFAYEDSGWTNSLAGWVGLDPSQIRVSFRRMA